MFNRKGAEFESYASQLQFSDSLVKSIFAYNQRYPDSILSVLKLLKSFGSDPYSEAFRVLRETNDLTTVKEQKDLKSEAKISIKGQVITCTSEVAELIKTAQEIAGPNNVIGTGHILIAESKRSESIILSTLITSRISPDSIKQGPAFINELVIAARKILKRSSEIGSTKSTLESDDSSTEIKVLDMIQAVKSGDIKEHAAKDDWIKNTLTALENTKVVAITSNNPEEAMSVIEGLAIALGTDRSGSFNYKGIIAINPTYLEQNSDLAIKEAIDIASGGILYLPDIESYLNNTRLKTAIASGKIRIITTTPQIPESEYKKIDRILKTATVLNLTPMSAAEAEKVINRNLKAIESELSNGQKITVSPEAIKESAYLANRYQTVLGLPTIQGAKLLIRHATGLLKLEMSGMDQFKSKGMKADLKIDPEDIDYALKDLKGIDPKPEDVEKYKYTAQELAKKIVGQDETLKDIAATLLRAKTGFGNPKRPIGSFLFLGPSGVGKSETAKVLAEFMFGSPEDLIVLNMSEFSEEHTVSALLGSPVGYKGSEQGGRLTEAVAKKPYAVLVLDEIEKADPAVLLALLRLLEEGTIQDRSGKLVDCRNLVIIATSNIGSTEASKQDELGRTKVVELVNAMAVAKLRPEFVNRFDKVEVFNTLSVQNLEKIVDIQLIPTKKNLSERGVQLTISDAARKHLAERGFDPKFGARPLRRLIEEKVVNSLAQLQASNELKTGMNILIDLKDNEIVLTK